MLADRSTHCRSSSRLIICLIVDLSECYGSMRSSIDSARRPWCSAGTVFNSACWPGALMRDEAAHGFSIEPLATAAAMF